MGFSDKMTSSFGGKTPKGPGAKPGKLEQLDPPQFTGGGTGKPPKAKVSNKKPNFKK